MSLLVIGLSHHTAPMPCSRLSPGAPAGALAHRGLGLRRRRASRSSSHVQPPRGVCGGAHLPRGRRRDRRGARRRRRRRPHRADGSPLRPLRGPRPSPTPSRWPAGLDSMAVGEAQVLGQLRDALPGRPARGHRRGVAELPSAASTSGRQAGSPRDGDRQRQPARSWRPASTRPSASSATSRRVTVLVVGAGGMTSLAATTAARRGVGRLVVANRTPRSRRAAGRDDRRTRRRDGAAGRVDRRGRRRDHLDRLGPVPRRRRPRRRVGRQERRATAVFVDLALPARRRPRRGRTCRARPSSGWPSLGAALAAGADVETCPRSRPSVTSSPARSPTTSPRGW